MSGRQGRPSRTYRDHQAEHAAECERIRKEAERAQQHAVFLQVRAAAGRYRVAQARRLTQPSSDCCGAPMRVVGGREKPRRSVCGAADEQANAQGESNAEQKD